MKILKRNLDINEIRSFVSEEIQKGGNLYYVVIDLRNGGVVVLNNKPKSDWYKPLCKLRLNGLTDTKNDVYPKVTEIRKAVMRYDRTVSCAIVMR